MAEVNDTTFTFRVDRGLKEAFAEAAAAEERTAAQLLRLLMRDTVHQRDEQRAHDAWFREEVRRGLEEADDAAVARVPHGGVASGWQQQRAELERRAAGRTA